MTAFTDPKFCVTCGTALIERVVLVGYDADTGRGEHSVDRRCPRRRWWGYGHPIFYRSITAHGAGPWRSTEGADAA